MCLSYAYDTTTGRHATLRNAKVGPRRLFRHQRQYNNINKINHESSPYLDFLQVLQVGRNVVHAEVDGGQRGVPLQRDAKQPDVVVLHVGDTRGRNGKLSNEDELGTHSITDDPGIPQCWDGRNILGYRRRGLTKGCTNRLVGQKRHRRALPQNYSGSPRLRNSSNNGICPGCVCDHSPTTVVGMKSTDEICGWVRKEHVVSRGMAVSRLDTVRAPSLRLYDLRADTTSSTQPTHPPHPKVSPDAETRANVQRTG